VKVIEGQLFSSAAGTDKIERIFRLRTQLQRMRRAVIPMVELCHRLDRHEFPT
jgi:Mg2+ and Co2+ transporter CorA